MDNMELIDQGFTGPKFTWRGTRNNSLVQERLDRGLVNGAWQARWPRTTVTHEMARASDHSPLIIDTDPEGMQTNHMFKFEAFWCKEAGCKDYRKKLALGCRGFVVEQMAQENPSDKRNLKRWNATSFRSMKNDIASLSDHLGRL